MGMSKQVVLAVFVTSMLGIGCGSDAKVPKSCVASEKTLSPNRVDSLLRPNIVQVVSGSTLGSGFMLQSDDTENVLIVTNYHVIAEGDEFAVAFVRKDGSRVKVSDVEVVKTNPAEDLALLKAPRMSAFGKGLELTDSPRTGQSVSTLGYPVLGGAGEKVEPTLSNGLVTSSRQKLDGRDFIQTNMQLIGGNSGGPAVDSCGRVLGVTAAHHAHQASVGFLVPSTSVREILARHLEPRHPSPDEGKARLAAFLQTLQNNEGREAATYLSRDFLSAAVFPKFKADMEAVLKKQALIEKVFGFLRSKGVNTDELSQEEFNEITRELGLSLTPDESFCFLIAMEAKQKGLDAYAMLQAYVAPFLDEYFGKIESYSVVDVKADGKDQVAHVVVQGPQQKRFFRFGLAYEWGDWQITDLSTRPGSGGGGGGDKYGSNEEATPGPGGWTEVVGKKR